MGNVISALLEALTLIASATREGSTIGNIIGVLNQLIPVLVQEYKDVLPAVRNIITALKSNPGADSAQFAALEALNAKVDAEFEAAATAAEAEDAATDPAPPPVVDAPPTAPETPHE